MNILIIILAITNIIVFAAIVFLFFRRRKQTDETQSFLMLQQHINEIGRLIDSKIFESTRLMQSQTSEISQSMQRIIRDVTQELVKVGEGQKQVMSVTDQLKALQDVLKNPKQRGVLGEYYLETVLKNVLPPNAYQMQYSFSDGTTVDAAIFVKDKIIPIDSKFSLENYNRMAEARDAGEREHFEKLFRQDLKNRIDETAKYVKPQEGTMDFSFMFIPAEAVFYDLLVNKVGLLDAQDLVEYAFKDRHVIIVSPTSFLAYLQTVLQGLRALQIEESAKEITKRVEELGRHLASYETYMKKLGTHLGTTVNMYNSAYRELRKVDRDILRVTGSSPEIEPQILPKPDTEEHSS